MIFIYILVIFQSQKKRRSCRRVRTRLQSDCKIWKLGKNYFSFAFIRWIYL